MKKFIQLVLGLILVFTLSSCGKSEPSSSGSAPTDEKAVEVAAQGAIKKYLNKNHDMDIESADVKINNIEKKEPYTTISGKDMNNSWFIESEVDGVMVIATIDFPNAKDFSITFLNYGIKNEIDDIE